MTASSPRGGRPSKGDRKAMKTRPPRPLAERAEAEAARLGIPVSDLIANALAKSLGEVEPFPAPSADSNQLKLTA